MKQSFKIQAAAVRTCVRTGDFTCFAHHIKDILCRLLVSIMPKIVITGFGIFAGVSRNPTEDIINSLRVWSLPECDISCTVLVCSVELLNDFILGIEKDVCGRYLLDDVLLVHLGVDSCAESFKLETNAYNNMTFRVPDQRGFSPDLACILPSKEFNSTLSSDLDMHKFCDELKSDKWGVEVSSDPGRYLCNYIYYNSLQLCCDRGSISNSGMCHSIFIHVPPVDRVPLEDQVAFVKLAVESIVKSMI